MSEESSETFDRFVTQFNRYLRVTKTAEDDKLDLLLLSVGDRVAGFYDEIEWPDLTEAEKTAGSTAYGRAVKFIRSKFSGDKNILNERLRLYSYRQTTEQSLNDYLSSIRSIAKYCEFSDSFSDEAVRDAFCLGLYDPSLKKSVCREFASFRWQGKVFTLNDAMATAEVEVNAVLTTDLSEAFVKTEMVAPVRERKKGYESSKKVCFWCGALEVRGRDQCPARGKTCHNCSAEGHFEKMCRKKKNISNIPIVGAVNENNTQKSHFLSSRVNGKYVKWLVDSGSELTLISKDVANSLSMGKLQKSRVCAQSAVGSRLKIIGKSNIALDLGDQLIPVTVHVVDRLCDPAILGINTFCNFQSLQINFKGDLPPLTVSANKCLLEDIENISDKPSVLLIDPVSIGSNLPQGQPVRTPSRFRCRQDNEFIKSEIVRLLAEGVIKPSFSAWRSQCFLTKSSTGKKRLVIDFSTTINRKTELDAFPVPLIATVLRELEGSKIFSRLDLRAAYHQVPIREDQQHFTAFEADGKLYEFTRLPFGITNGVPVFCRVMKNLTSGLCGVTHYFDDVVIHGHDQASHDKNLKAFLDRSKEFGLSFNLSKCEFNTHKLVFLGHSFDNGSVSPDRSRMAPLIDYPLPKNMKQLERLVGLLVYYSKWVANFAEKAEPIFTAKLEGSFPLDAKTERAISGLKSDISEASLAVPDDKKHLTLEIDASLTCIRAALTQEGRPIAFFSHKLSDSEKKWPIVELEAYAILRSMDYFPHFLLGRKFELLTDQKSVSFLFDSSPKNKIKNSKINRWRLAAAEFNFDIRYRVGFENVPADAFSRISSIHTESDASDVVKKIHEELGHPGSSRLYHFMSEKFPLHNLQNQISDCVKKCSICAKEKPRFLSLRNNRLITSSKPWQRLSIDFMGPKPSKTGNQYIFTVIDEFSRFPFAFAVRGPSSYVAIKCLTSLFSLFGPPHCIHSDRGTAFESREFQAFLKEWNILKSRTTPYHPAGNGQVERMNGTLWQTIRLRLSQNGRPIEFWKVNSHRPLPICVS